MHIEIKNPSDLMPLFSPDVIAQGMKAQGTDITEDEVARIQKEYAAARSDIEVDIKPTCDKDNN